MATNTDGGAQAPAAPEGQDFLDVLNFDPFDEPADGPQEGEPAEGAETDGGAEPAQAGEQGGESEGGAAPEGTPPAAAAAETPPANPEMEMLRAQLEEMRTQNAQLMQAFQQQQGQGQGQGQPSQGQGGEAPPSFAYNIPPKLAEMLGSEDMGERVQALGAFAQGISQTMYGQVMQAVQAQMQQVPQMIQSHAGQQSQSQQVFQDFYGAFPELNRPELRDLVGSVAKQVSAETGLKQWSPVLRDAIGQRIRTLLGVQTPAAAPAAAAAPARRQPFVAGATSRPAPTPKTTGNEPDDIMSTLFG